MLHCERTKATPKAKIAEEVEEIGPNISKHDVSLTQDRKHKTNVIMIMDK